MTVLENDSTGKCARYWKMIVLENGGTGNKGTGKRRYWKMAVLENDSTANDGIGK